MIPNSFPDRSVCIIGLGYVGMTLATVMADCGFDVLGIEIRDDVLKKLDQGEPHFHEPGMSELLKRLVKQKKIHFAKHIPDGCDATVFIITVGTPIGPNGKTRLDMIERVASEISGHLKNNNMVILRSTVKLGTTSSFICPILEKSGKSFDIAFCPERTVEGYALTELRQLPQIVGGLTLKATVRAAQLFQLVTPSVVRVSDPETAEMIKLVDNAHRDVYLAYGNEVARMCDAAGVSAIEVINAGKLGYPRTHVYLPGPVGGPCLEKDPHILAESMEEFGIVPEISVAARRTNEGQPEEIISYIDKFTKKLPGFPKAPVISLLGIAFKGKPPTDDLRGTMARPIFNALKHHFPHAEFKGFDPLVAQAALKEFGLTPCSTLEKAFEKSDMVLILNNHPLFGQMNLEELAANLKRPAVIYDFWNNFSTTELQLPKDVAYIALGSHTKAQLNYDVQKISRYRRGGLHRRSSRKTTRTAGSIRARAR